MGINVSHDLDVSITHGILVSPTGAEKLDVFSVIHTEMFLIWDILRDEVVLECLGIERNQGMR